MMRRLGDRLGASCADLLRRELDGMRTDLTTSWTSSFDELRRDVNAQRDELHVRVADRDLELVNTLHRVADAFQSIADSIEADRRDRRTQLDVVEFLLREMVLRQAQPTAVASVVLGGSVDPGALRASRGEVDIDLSGSPILVDAHVEVLSHFDDRWVHGFAVTEYVHGPRHRGYRLRRLSDTEPLPSLFDAADVRPTTVASDLRS